MLYLIHATKDLDRPTTGGVRHYIGFAEDHNIWQRLRQHAKNQSNVRIIKAFHAVGAELLLVRLWPGATRDDERRVKSSRHPILLCPICQRGNPRRLRSIPTDIPLSIPLSSLLLINGPSSVALGSTLGGMPELNRGRSHLSHGVGNTTPFFGTPTSRGRHPSG